MALVLLMGIPGSGKTYLCKELKAKLGDEMCVTFSYDDIFNDDGFMEYMWGKEYNNIGMLQLYGLDNPRSVHSERKRCENRIREFLKERLSTENIIPPVIVVDDIFYLKSMRRPFHRMSTMFHFPYLVVFVDVPISIALKRNMQRPEKCRISESTIRKIHEAMELPSKDDDNFIIYQSTDDLESLVEHINRIRWKMNEWLISKKDINSSRNDKISLMDNKWMRLELDLRRCVGELIREKNIGAEGNVLNEMKKKLYWKIRTDDVIDWDVQKLKDNLWENFQV